MLYDVTINHSTHVGVKEMMFVGGNLLIKGFDYEGYFYKHLIMDPEIKSIDIERSDIDESKISMEEMASAFQSLDMPTPMQIL